MNNNNVNKYINSPYRWIIDGLIWGLIMFLVVGVFYPWAKGDGFVAKNMFFHLLWWLGSGLIYGYFTPKLVKFFEQKFARKNNRNTE